MVDGKPAPLIVATEGQINAVVPYGLAANTQHQVVLQKGNSYTVPEAITVAAAQPAMFAKDGRTRAGCDHPGRGEVGGASDSGACGMVIVIYCTGLGEANPAVDTGQPAAASPLSRATSEVKLTIGEWTRL